MRKFLVSIFTEEWGTWRKLWKSIKTLGYYFMFFYTHATFGIVVFPLLNLHYPFQLSLEFWLWISAVCGFPCGCWHRTPLRSYSIIFHWVPGLNFQHLSKAWVRGLEICTYHWLPCLPHCPSSVDKSTQYINSFSFCAISSHLNY